MKKIDNQKFNQNHIISQDNELNSFQRNDGFSTKWLTHIPRKEEDNDAMYKLSKYLFT